jgi:hypothetical protein
MPVAANHGAARIMKMNVMRPPYLAWHPPATVPSRPGLFHASTEMLRECCRLGTTISCAAHTVVRCPLVAASEASRKKEILACDVGCHAVLRGWFAIRFAGPQFLLRNLAADHMADF